MLSRHLKLSLCSRFKRTVLLSRNLSSNSSDGVTNSPFPRVELPKVTIHDYIWENLDRWPEHTALVCGVTGRGYTYERLFRTSTTLAAALRSKLGIQDGDCTTVMLPNCPDFAVATLATLMAGAAMSGINPTHTAYEVQRQLISSDAKIVFTNITLSKTVLHALQLAKLNIPVVVLRDPGEDVPQGVILFDDLVEDMNVDLSCLKKVRRSTDDVAFIHYSSGTTGMPKGVELTHRNIVANNQQLSEPSVIHTRETTKNYQDAVMAILPFFHSYGSTVVMLNKLSVGAKVVTMPKFHTETFLKNVKKYKARLIYAAPPMVMAMSSHELSTPEYLKPIDIIMCGAAPLPVADVHKLFDKAKRMFSFIQAYGLTETSPVATITPTNLINYSTIGFPVSNSQIKMVDDQGNTVPDGTAGEILIRGPHIMRGYRNNPQATADAIKDGWFYSGDLGYKGQDGALYMSDRLKELIKVKGFQVAPAELEAILKEHPGVQDAAVVGVTDPRSGEVPKAFIVKAQGSKVEDSEIQQFVNERVAPYKRIGSLQVLDSIPRNPSGKILRREIREKYC